MKLESQQKKTVIILSAGAAAASALGLMFWRASAKDAAVLPPADRLQKLANAEQTFHRMFPKVPTVTAQQTRELLQQQPDKYVVVDVRNSDEQQVSMLPGARVLTQQQYEQQKQDLKDATAICLCTVGYRSGVYAQELQQQGIEAANLSGGILAWTQAGLPLVEGTDRQQPTQQVHTYAARWAFHGEGYTPVFYRFEYFRMVQDELSRLKKRVFGG